MRQRTGADHRKPSRKRGGQAGAYQTGTGGLRIFRKLLFPALHRRPGNRETHRERAVPYRRGEQNPQEPQPQSRVQMGARTRQEYPHGYNDPHVAEMSKGAGYKRNGARRQVAGERKYPAGGLAGGVAVQPTLYKRFRGLSPPTDARFSPGDAGSRPEACGTGTTAPTTS